MCYCHNFNLKINNQQTLTLLLISYNRTIPNVKLSSKGRNSLFWGRKHICIYGSLSVGLADIVYLLLPTFNVLIIKVYQRLYGVQYSIFHLCYKSCCNGHMSIVCRPEKNVNLFLCVPQTSFSTVKSSSSFWGIMRPSQARWTCNLIPM